MLLVLTIALWYAGYLRFVRIGVLIHSSGKRYTEFSIVTENGGISPGFDTATEDRSWSYLDVYTDHVTSREYAGGYDTAHLGFGSASLHYNGGWNWCVYAPAWFWTFLTAILPIIWIVRRFRRHRPGRCGQH